MNALPDAAGTSVFQQLIDIWIRPEIERRRAAGALAHNFVLHAAQLICSADGEPNKVRLNQEVQAIALVRKKVGVAKEKGDTVYLDEIEGVETIVLPETEDPNCGHATLISFGDRWYVVFDFRYNRGRSVALLSRARQFLAAATQAHATAAWSAFAYNLFTAAELTAKAELLVVPDEKLLRSKKHDAIHSRLNKWAKLGNVDVAHASAFNDLATLRQRAAYSFDEFVMEPEQAVALLGAVAEFVERVAARAAPTRTARSSSP